MTDPIAVTETFDTAQRQTEKETARARDTLKLLSKQAAAGEINRTNSVLGLLAKVPQHVLPDQRDGACLVGGQSVAVWAAVLDPDGDLLADHTPFTTADIDFIGDFKIAKKFSEATGGTLYRPSADTMNSNSTALVRVPIDNEFVTVDFLHSIIGVNSREISQGTVKLTITDGVGRIIEVPVLHPVLVMRSRIANMLSTATMRRDLIAFNQARAAIRLLSLWIDARLNEGQVRDAMKAITACVSHATIDYYGKRSVRDLSIDQLDAVIPFLDDARLDDRWRRLTLRPRIEECELKRARSLETR